MNTAALPPAPSPKGRRQPDPLTPDERFRAVADLWARALLRLHAKGLLPPAPPSPARSDKSFRQVR